MINKDLDKEIKKFVRWSRKVGYYGLAKCSSGNLSHRLNDSTILVTETRSWLSELKPKQVIQFDPIERKVIQGGKPTGELPLHLAIFAQNPEVSTVLHFQSPAATALACWQVNEINYNVIIEVPIYIGSIAHIPYIMPGSEELAIAVAGASISAGIIQLQNHGQVAVGKNYKDAFQKAVFFELACNIIISGNKEMNYLSPEQINMLSNYRK